MYALKHTHTHTHEYTTVRKLHRYIKHYTPYGVPTVLCFVATVAVAGQTGEPSCYALEKKNNNDNKTNFITSFSPYFFTHYYFRLTYVCECDVCTN